MAVLVLALRHPLNLAEPFAKRWQVFEIVKSHDWLKSSRVALLTEGPCQADLKPFPFWECPFRGGVSNARVRAATLSPAGDLIAKLPSPRIKRLTEGRVKLMSGW
jgi:hypothetical protein